MLFWFRHLMYFGGQQWIFRVCRGLRNMCEKTGGSENVVTVNWDFEKQRVVIIIYFLLNCKIHFVFRTYLEA